jgi:hypothetical protein
MINALFSSYRVIPVTLSPWRLSLPRPHVAVDLVTTTRSGGVYLAHHLLQVDLATYNPRISLYA